MARRTTRTIRPRAFVLWLLLAAVPVPLALVATVVGIADPYQVYRASDWVMGDERYIMPGLARNQPFDTVVVGNSMSQNFTRSPTASVLGGQVINLSISGGMLYEVNNVLQVALRSGKVRHVLWGIDPRGAMGAQETRTANYPEYLYDDNPFNDIHYLYNFTVLQTAVGKLMSPHRSRRNLETMMAWYSVPMYRPGRKTVLRSDFLKRNGIPSAALSAGKTPAGEAERFATTEDNLERNVLRTIRDHPEVRFDIFVPPFSTLHYACLSRNAPDHFATTLATMNYMFSSLTAQPNVTLHFFGSFAGVADNLDNYKDTSHYSVAVSHRILHEIRQGTYRVTPENYRARLDEWVAHVRAYDIERDLRDIPAG